MMQQRSFLLGTLVVALVLLTLLPLASAQDSPGPDANSGGLYPLMRFTLDELEASSFESTAVPEYILPDGYSPEASSRDLLSYLPLIPEKRDQGWIGNCWVWSATGTMEIDYTLQSGSKKRLSIEYFDWLYNGGKGDHWAGNGGWPWWFTDFYTNTSTWGGKMRAVQWSNNYAEFLDGYKYNPASGHDDWCAANKMCWVTHKGWRVDTTNSYRITEMTLSEIKSRSDRSAMIQRIKSAIDGNHAPDFSFFLPNSAAWNKFFEFWRDGTENDVWNMGQYSGVPYNSTEGAGHSVLCVGYDDASDSYIMVNSWGTTKGRPNGLFRVKMHYDYEAYYPMLSRPGKKVPASLWHIIETTYGGVKSTPVPVISSLFPRTGVAGSNGIIMTLTGTDFVKESKVLWNGAEHETRYISSERLRVNVPASDLVKPGRVMISVENPSPGSGTSNQLPFTIRQVLRK